ncbi:MAG: nucleotide pyrophosphohydrolase [Candidatus Aenigmarchaeota archaeon]|nr:nucleotide pyrophosphohydrolase [Candidatus Aenigmarchaeota archaeon]
MYELKKLIREFVAERGWKKYHNLKDLSIALIIEASELLDIFKWRNVEKVEKNSELMLSLKEELADVIIYALRLSDVANIDVAQAVREKIKKNAEKYPANIRYEW